MSKQIKQLEMDSLEQTFKDVRDVVFLSVSGVNAQLDNQVRLALRKKNIRLQVVKNSLASRVFSLGQNGGGSLGLMMAVFGIGTILGPVVGSLVLVPLSEALRANLITDLLIKAGLVSETSRTGVFLKENLAHAHVLIYGILVVVVILFMPEGVLGFVKKLMARREARTPAAEAPARPEGAH